MKSPTRPVSIHPYFKVNFGQMDAVKTLLREFIQRVSAEPGTLSYDFTIGGDVVFCREAYVDGAALLAHMVNVSAQIDRMLILANLIRVEVHGPAVELEKLKGPLAGLKPEWFVYECGLEH